MLVNKISLILSLHYMLVYGVKDGKKMIKIDYYGRGSVRHSRVEMNCELALHKLYCQYKCSKSRAVCIEGNCYCIKGNMTGLLPNRNIGEPEDLPSKESSKDDKSKQSYLNYEPEDPNSRSVRRHHIAHFCPNLDEARKCIRKCMTKGKPAFCGKDHVCYCGHKYELTDGMDKSTENVAEMYAQFKDLYDKYFGINTINHDHNTEPEEEDEEYSNHEIVEASYFKP